MYNLAKDSSIKFSNSALKLFQWCADHPYLLLMLLLYYIVIPVLARDVRRQYWRLECGTFEARKLSTDSTLPSGLFFADDSLCFIPLKELAPDLMMCYLGDKSFFDKIPSSDDAIKIDALNNPKLTICDTFNKLRNSR